MSEVSIYISLIFTHTGSLSTSNGSGTGNINVSLRRMTSSVGGAEVQVGCGRGLMLSAREFGNLTKRNSPTE